MADLLFPIIPPQIQRRSFDTTKFVSRIILTKSFAVDIDLDESPLKFLIEILQNDLQQDMKRNQMISPTLQVCF